MGQEDATHRQGAGTERTGGDTNRSLWRVHVVDVYYYYALSISCWCLEYIPDSARRKGKNNVEWGEVEWFRNRGTKVALLTLKTAGRLCRKVP